MSDLEQPPPVFGSWRRAYLVVALNLAVTIALGYLLTRWYA